MLVLTRKSLESVVIGGSPTLQQMVKVTVLEIRGGKVKLGFEAGCEVPIQRLEVWQRIHAEEVSATLTEDICAA